MRFLVLFLAVVMSGCEQTGELDNNNHGFGFDIDATDTATGITVKYNEADTYKFPIDLIVEAYHITENCIGLYSDKGPPVVLTNNFENLTVDGHKNLGLFHSNPVLVVAIDEQLKKGDTGVLTHEFIHYLLYVNNLPYVHTVENGPLFEWCSL